MPAKRKSSSETGSGSVETRSDEPNTADRIAQTALTYLLEQIEAIKGGKAKKNGHDPASRIAFLAAKAAQISAEQRKAEGAALANARKLTEAQVRAWFVQQPEEARARIVRELAQVDTPGRKSVLG